MALSAAGASGGGAICEVAAAVPADQSRAHVRARAKPGSIIRAVADARFILTAPCSILGLKDPHSESGSRRLVTSIKSTIPETTGIPQYRAERRKAGTRSMEPQRAQAEPGGENRAE